MSIRRPRQPLGGGESIQLYNQAYRYPIGGYGRQRYSNWCVDFDGSNDFITMGNVFDKTHTDAWTITAWVKSSSSFANLRCIGGKRSGAGYQFWVYPSLGRLYIAITNTGGGVNEIVVYTNGTTVCDGQWHFIAASYDGLQAAAGCKVTLDGNNMPLNVTYDTLNATITNAGSFQIGAFGGANYPFESRIDDFALWDTDLSLAEIQEARGRGPGNLENHSAVANLEGYWLMGDEDTYPTIADHVGSNDGTMTNMSAGDIVLDSIPIAA